MFRNDRLAEFQMTCTLQILCTNLLNLITDFVKNKACYAHLTQERKEIGWEETQKTVFKWRTMLKELLCLHKPLTHDSSCLTPNLTGSGSRYRPNREKMQSKPVSMSIQMILFFSGVKKNMDKIIKKEKFHFF